MRKLEEMVSKVIAAKDDVERKICDSSDILSREEVRKAFEEDHILCFVFFTSFCSGGHCARSNLPGDDICD